MPHKDPEVKKEYNKLYRARHRERILRQQMQKYWADPAYRADRLQGMKAQREKTLRKNPLKYLYDGIRTRCCNPKAENYGLYGGRGIQMCDEWLSSFESFKIWALNHGWERDLQIDRIDNDGNYESSNCRFVTPQINSQKKRNSKLALEDVVIIKQLLLVGNLHKEIAARFNVTRNHISNINSGQRWTNA